MRRLKFDVELRYRKNRAWFPRVVRPDRVYRNYLWRRRYHTDEEFRCYNLERGRVLRETPGFGERMAEYARGRRRWLVDNCPAYVESERQRERERWKKIKADPVKHEAYKVRQRAKYQRRKLRKIKS